MTLTSIELLNQIVTNTLLYKEKLKTLSKRSYSEETNLKLKDFVDTREKQVNELIEVINGLGGRVQSTPQRTDAARISWCPEVLPRIKDIIALLNYLITAEQNSLEDYDRVLDRISKPDIESQLKEHIQQGEATLQYLEVALETNRASKRN